MLLLSPQLRAQSGAGGRPVIGFLGSTSATSFAPFLDSFLQGLSESGYIVGRNIDIEYRWADGRFDRLPVLARELVAMNVAVIVASGGTPPPAAAMAATSTIPIIFTGAGDPVAAGLVASLARPGGNVTGFSIISAALMPKRLELLTELVPQARNVALLLNPKSGLTERSLTGAQDLAQAKGIQLQVLKASTMIEVASAFETISRAHIEALVVADDPFFASQRVQIVTLAASHQVPAIYQFRDFVAAGGLISYGVSLRALYRQAAIQTVRVLQGANPRNLPVQQASVFELAINLNTAKALGLTIPLSILGRADEMID
ncbi:MAG: ABC transporter substrate-binding protein [Proteobacteria bacterium]|nr:ABC transporter substrate-binding protein [Pseudomonadota bacterium]